MVISDFEVDGALGGVGAELRPDFADGGQEGGGGVAKSLRRLRQVRGPQGPGTSPSPVASGLADRSCHPKGRGPAYSRDAHCMSSLLGIGSRSSLRPARWS